MTALKCHIFLSGPYFLKSPGIIKGAIHQGCDFLYMRKFLGGREILRKQHLGNDPFRCSGNGRKKKNATKDTSWESLLLTQEAKMEWNVQGQQHRRDQQTIPTAKAWTDVTPGMINLSCNSLYRGGLQKHIKHWRENGEIRTRPSIPNYIWNLVMSHITKTNWRVNQSSCIDSSINLAIFVELQTGSITLGAWGNSTRCKDQVTFPRAAYRI